jgi:alanyl-tRNA synthetase
MKGWVGPMTERLYYTDAYLREFDATVVERTDGGRRIYLDRTAFYPTSGGQPFDTGRLGEVQVLDVVDEGERIAHQLDGPVADDRIIGRIDWDRRFDHMQQHTGQHLLSAVIADLLGHATMSVHFGDSSSTLDLDAGEIELEQVVAVEARANAVVTEDRAVEVGFESATGTTGLRKPSAREGTLRIITIDRLDRSACGGTHVRATGEIGAILIGKIERVRKTVRLEFVCGGRAVRRARSDHDLLVRLAGLYSASPGELPALLEGQRGELRRAAASVRELEHTVARYRAAELYAAATLRPSGRRVIVLREETGPLERLRPLAQAVAALSRAAFLGVVSQPPGVLVATSEDSGIGA